MTRASGPGPAEDGRGAGAFPLAILLLHTGKLLHDQMRSQLERIGLHPSQGRVLRLLSMRDGVSQQELTRRMGIAAPTISGILKRMEAAGLIERRGDAEDERITRVCLTRRGRRSSRAADQAVSEIERMLIDGLSARRQRDAHALLRKLRDNLGGHAPGREPSAARAASLGAAKTARRAGQRGDQS